jgi:hypothetical protein
MAATIVLCFIVWLIGWVLTSIFSTVYIMLKYGLGEKRVAHWLFAFFALWPVVVPLFMLGGLMERAWPLACSYLFEPIWSFVYTIALIIASRARKEK